MDQCVRVGLVKGEHMSVDGSFVQADATNGSRIARATGRSGASEPHGSGVSHRTGRAEWGRGAGADASAKQGIDHGSYATYFSKGNMFATLGYFDNYLIDNPSCVIVGVQGTGVSLRHESMAARDMIFAFHQRYGHYPLSLAADTGYGNGEMLNWLLEREITPYVPVRKPRQGQNYMASKSSPTTLRPTAMSARKAKP